MYNQLFKGKVDARPDSPPYPSEPSPYQGSVGK